MPCERTEIALARREAEPDGQWVTGWVECRACGDTHVAVAPFPEPGLSNLECPRCGAMACEGDVP